jgi:hypothetical protein
VVILFSNGDEKKFIYTGECATSFLVMHMIERCNYNVNLISMAGDQIQDFSKLGLFNALFAFWTTTIKMNNRDMSVAYTRWKVGSWVVERKSKLRFQMRPLPT